METLNLLLSQSRFGAVVFIILLVFYTLWGCFRGEILSVRVTSAVPGTSVLFSMH